MIIVEMSRHMIQIFFKYPHKYDVKSNFENPSVAIGGKMAELVLHIPQSSYNSKSLICGKILDLDSREPCVGIMRRGSMALHVKG